MSLIITNTSAFIIINAIPILPSVSTYLLVKCDDIYGRTVITSFSTNHIREGAELRHLKDNGGYYVYMKYCCLKSPIIR